LRDSYKVFDQTFFKKFAGLGSAQGFAFDSGFELPGFDLPNHLSKKAVVWR